MKIGDSFFTFESGEEKQCDLEVAKTLTPEEIEAERTELWNKLNADVDNQVEDIIASFKTKK